MNVQGVCVSRLFAAAYLAIAASEALVHRHVPFLLAFAGILQAPAKIYGALCAFFSVSGVGPMLFFVMLFSLLVASSFFYIGFAAVALAIKDLLIPSILKRTAIITACTVGCASLMMIVGLAVARSGIEDPAFTFHCPSALLLISLIQILHRKIHG